MTKPRIIYGEYLLAMLDERTRREVETRDANGHPVHTKAMPSPTLTAEQLAEPITAEVMGLVLADLGKRFGQMQRRIDALESQQSKE